MLKYIHIYVVSLFLFVYSAAELIRSEANTGSQQEIKVGNTDTSIVSAPDAVALEEAAPKVEAEKASKPTRVFYGQASYYASKFEGRKTATGETFRHSKLTAACNFLPLGTWIKITNLKNGKSIFAKTNDRLHTKTKRIIDLTNTGAKKLGYVANGLTRVKVEVLKNRPA